MARGADRKGLETQQIRRWNVGDVYAPHDLSGVEQSKWKKFKSQARPRWDVLDQLNIKPMDHYKVCGGRVIAHWDKQARAGRRLDADDNFFAELQHHVRVRDGNGQDQAQLFHRSASAQPAQDGQGRQEGDWFGSDSQCVQAPSNSDDRGGLHQAYEQAWPLSFMFERFVCIIKAFVQFYFTRECKSERAMN